MRGLVTDREAIQKQIDALKIQKDRSNPPATIRRWRSLLTELALKTRAIRDLKQEP